MKTKVFISWSGKSTDSFRVAKKLYDWLPMILQATEPFMSDNIAAGTGFLNQIMDSLSTAKVGIICVTKENAASPWLNFEAGALSNVVTTNEGVAIPLLIGMTTNELSACNSPIKNFQAVEFNDEGIERMLHSINNLLEYPLKESQLEMLLKQSKAMLLEKKKIEAKSENDAEEDDDTELTNFFRKVVDENKPGSQKKCYEPSEYNPDHVEVLELCGYIKCRRYINGSISISPTRAGIKYYTTHFLDK